MFAESPRRKKKPPLSTAAKLASLCKFGKSGGAFADLIQKPCFPSIPSAISADKMDWMEAKKRRTFLHSKAVGAFFSFFFRLNLCAKSVSEFSLVPGFFYCTISLCEKAGKGEVVSGADSSSGLKYDLPCPPPLGDHLRAKMMEYSPAESGKAEHFYEAEFLDLFFFCPLKTSSCERGH